MGRIRSHIKTFCLVLAFFSLQLSAEGIKQEQGPYQKIEAVTSELLIIIEAHKESFDEDENAYFQEVEQLLSDHVDFPYIAKYVMGGYAKKASSEQRKEFATTFRHGLVETYGRGLIGYNNEKIVTLPAKELEEGQRVVVVKQKLHAKDAVYPLGYTVARKKTGEWKVINMFVNGINLRETLRNQFLNSAAKAEGDIDQVIAGWNSTPG